MPRRARLAVAGIPWHIIQRGNNRNACFYADEDYQYYLEILGEQAEKHGCQIHAYVLMTNHVHVLLTPENTDSVALTMKHLGQRYVQYINRTYRRSGTLWEGRFRSCLTKEREYVLACYRYIELNPVRANMVTHPRHYRWSSYRCNAEGRTNPLITPQAEYLGLGGYPKVRQTKYRNLFDTQLDPRLVTQVRDSTNSFGVLGSERFQTEIEKMLKRRVRKQKPGRKAKEKV